MKWSSATFLGLATSAVADIGLLKPDVSTPDGCKASVDGRFQVSVYSLGNSKRGLEKRACGGEGTLVMTLKDSVLKDSHDRTGAIVANRQFQFDGPPQAGSIFTGGFSVCNNGSLALGGSTVFYRCLSGDFYNLYDKNWAPQCAPIEIVANFCDGGSKNGGGNAGPKPVATSLVPTAVVTLIGDGQPQVHTTLMPVPMCKTSDGKIIPCAEVPPVAQIGDGQIQGPTGPAFAPPVSQIGDGQIQAPKTAAPPPPIAQVHDGQPQAPVKTPAPGAPAATPAVPPVNQIGDGQIQAPTGPAPTVPVSTPSPTAAAEKLIPGLAAAVAIVAFLL
ncbi:hypothetical protein E4U42_004818 [Claviceps africana]|uniref:Cell wall mannoprotein PIR1-like C-terminal domain-containing protein n=1 Tax=Claviceps africana TaxID=83212 RepID=A0A8K0J4L3_9HYPO|nr:hypothetical protein E4U42_004818 [Claviceps africana]